MELHTVDLAIGILKRGDDVTGRSRLVKAGRYFDDMIAVAHPDVQLEREPSAIQRRDLATGAVTLAYADASLWSYYPRVSPDGQWLALSLSPEHHEGENWDLALVSTTDPSRRLAQARLRAAEEAAGRDDWIGWARAVMAVTASKGLRRAHRSRWSR